MCVGGVGKGKTLQKLYKESFTFGWNFVLK